MTKRPLRHIMATTTTTSASDSANLLSRFRKSFRRSLRRSARTFGTWRESRRKQIFVSPDLRHAATKANRDEVSSSSSACSSAGVDSRPLWKTIVRICLLFLLHNSTLILNVINFKATSPPTHPICDSQTTGKLFLYGFSVVSNDTKTEVTPVPLVNNVWIGLGLLQNIWIGYSIAGLFRRSGNRRFVEHSRFPSDGLVSSYLHAILANLLFFFFFDRKFYVAAFCAIFISAVYAILSVVAMTKDVHRLQDALLFSFPSDVNFLSPLLVSPLATWGAWVIIGVIHVATIVAVNVFHCDDAVASIIAACVIAAGDLVFMIIDVTKCDVYTRRILGPYIAIVVFLIGAVLNHVAMVEASKFVVIGCAIVAILIFVARCALLCYRNKRRRRANIRTIDDLAFRS